MTLVAASGLGGSVEGWEEGDEAKRRLSMSLACDISPCAILRSVNSSENCEGDLCTH